MAPSLSSTQNAVDRSPIIIKPDGEPPGRRRSLTLAWLLGSAFLLSRRCRRARGCGFGVARCARDCGFGVAVALVIAGLALPLRSWLRVWLCSLPSRSRLRLGFWGLGFWQRFAMLGHGSVSFHCTSSALGSFVTKASRLETGLLISSHLISSHLI